MIKSSTIVFFGDQVDKDKKRPQSLQNKESRVTVFRANNGQSRSWLLGDIEILTTAVHTKPQIVF